MRFEVRLFKKTYRQLEALDKEVARRILEKLRELEENPFPKGVLKLQGLKDSYRIRVGDYRILYTILYKEKIILVFRIEHRRGAYQ